MKQIKTLSNSFLLQEVDSNGNIISELGFRKGGLSYLIKNNNVKFYLTEDYFYKNVVWSADIPLNIDGVVYDINTVTIALKKIFIMDKEEDPTIVIDQELDSGSTNAIANQAVTRAVNSLQDQVAENTRGLLERYTKAETNSLLQNYYTKLETNAMFANYSKVIDNDTLSINNENITI
jgi:hypothetical protein